MAYRRLLTGPDSNSAQSITLQQVCLNAIQRFSPSALQSRSTPSPGRWGIPEAAFQDEMYCCLNYELRNLPILSEYSHTKDGRVDFYVFDKKWCIEVLQCGSKARIAEHAARFAPGGTYRTWNICEDYIILNFCSKSTLSEIEIEGNCLFLVFDIPLFFLTRHFFVRRRGPIAHSTGCCGPRGVYSGGIHAR